MLVRLEENRIEKLLAHHTAENKWSPRRTFLFLIASGVLCWSAILFLVYLVVS